LLQLFNFISSCINSLFLPEIPFSNNQMVSTRSGEGQDIPPVVRAHIANQQNQAPPPPLNLAMDLAMQQFLAAQMQLIKNLTATIQNIQAQQNQPLLAAPPAPVNKHMEFMSHRPPTYSHSTDPLDADD
jgi:hypothetical protein